MAPCGQLRINLNRYASRVVGVPPAPPATYFPHHNLLPSMGEPYCKAAETMLHKVRFVERPRYICCTFLHRASATHSNRTLYSVRGNFHQLSIFSLCRIADTCNNKCEVITAVFSPGARLTCALPCFTQLHLFLQSRVAALTPTPRPCLRSRQRRGVTSSPSGVRSVRQEQAYILLVPCA